MGIDLALQNGERIPDLATRTEDDISGGPIVAPRQPQFQPSQRAVDIKHVGLLPIVVLGIGYGLLWIGNNVVVPWQNRLLGADAAQANFIAASVGLVKLIDQKQETEAARSAKEQDNATAMRSLAEAVINLHDEVQHLRREVTNKRE